MILSLKITDSINREITISYGNYLEDSYFDTVAYKGFGGSEKQIKINHNKLQYALKPGESLKNGFQLFPSVGTVVLNSNATALITELDEYKKTTPTENSLVGDEYNPKVITSIVFPNNQQYTLLYNSYGELARSISPLESYTDFEYGAIDDSRADGFGVMFSGYGGIGNQHPYRIHRRGTEINTFDSANIRQTKTTYSIAGGISPVTVKQFAGDGTTLLSAMKHYFFNGSDVPSIIDTDFNIFSHGSWKQNREYKTEILDTANLNTVLRKTESTFEQRQPVSWWRSGLPECLIFTIPANSQCITIFEPQNDPRLTEVKSTLETGQVTKKTFSYDQFNNVTDTYEYDYGDVQAGQFLRRSHTDYLTDPNYISLHMKGLPWQTWVSSDLAGNNKVSRSQVEYDDYSVNPLISRSNVSGHNSTNYSTSNIRRGNATKVTTYSDVNNSSTAISAQTQFDILGNVVKSFDAKGNFSSIDYTDRFGSPDAEARSNNYPTQLNGKSTFAFPTSATNPLGYSSYSQFDYFSSLAVDVEDLNENVSTIFYNDILDRPTQTIAANNRASLRSQTTTTYDDIGKKVTVTSDLLAFGDNLVKGESFYDSLGRTIETRSYETSGYTVTAKPQYDDLGRVVKSTNPYRPFMNEQPVWTTTEYDVLGRVSKIKTPDNAEATTSFFGNATTVIDQAGKKRRSITNAIGQVIRVDEPNNDNDLGDIATPTQPTNYTYSTAGNLVKVSQGQQNRFFHYDSLGRLIRVRQPEQDTNSALNLADPITGNSNWSTASTYDANGNSLTTTDAKGVIITQTYDVLNRPLIRSYSDGTPTVTNTYDGANIPNSRGQMTKTSSTISTSEYTAFDIVGKVLSHKQITDGQTYNTAYSYNLSGALIEETYPSGRIVKNTLDNDGRLAMVQSSKSNVQGLKLYANAFTYTSAGAVTSMRLGNGKFENTTFNSRLQPTQIGLGSSATNQNLLKINLNYGGTDNNGSVKAQTINIGNTAFTQTYLYDSLQRLTEAKEVTGTTQNWIQNFSYDRFGNRTSFNQLIGTTQTNQTPTVDPSNNRLTTGQGFTYDFNGNLITDNQGRQFSFNGDNKQTQVKDANNIVVGTYKYDGSGARIKKITASETTIFVYNAGGKLVAEYSTQTASNPTISYLTSDNLGSPRITTDANGQVVSRRDFMPFGEEISRANYGTDSIRQRFTGYEKDIETGLDFAEARYYNNQHGRFTAVDPLLASGNSSNPQTFNRYVYVANNPINAIDPTGLNAIVAFSMGIENMGAGTGDAYTDPFPSVPEPVDLMIPNDDSGHAHETLLAALEDLPDVSLPANIEPTVNVPITTTGYFGRTLVSVTLAGAIYSDLQKAAQEQEKLWLAYWQNIDKARNGLTAFGDTLNLKNLGDALKIDNLGNLTNISEIFLNFGIGVTVGEGVQATEYREIGVNLATGIQSYVNAANNQIATIREREENGASQFAKQNSKQFVLIDYNGGTRNRSVGVSENFLRFHYRRAEALGNSAANLRRTGSLK